MESSPRLRPMGDLVREVAAARGDHLAVDGPQTLSYAALWRAATAWSHLLAEHGVGRGDRVALVLDRGPTTTLVQLATVLLGAAFVPVDPAYPIERVRAVVTRSTPRVVVVRPGPGLADLLDGAPTAPSIDPDDPLVDRQLRRPGLVDLEVAVDPGDPAYVIHTSGSTGLPKGVVVTHRGITAMVAAQRCGLGAGPDSRVLAFASPSFDASVWETWMALGSGGTLIQVPKGEVLESGLAQVARRWGATHLTVPSSILGDLDPEDLDPGTTVVVAGEAFPADLARRWAGQVRLVNAYGPTESTVCATMSPRLRPAGIGDTVSIGAAVVGIDARVADEDGHAVPAGVPGELLLAGAALADGYLGRPAETAARFVPDATATTDAGGRRCYRTGDRVVRQADGSFDFIGRTDRQVKLRGHRIELGEVESLVSGLPGIDQVAVLLQATPLPSLVAHVATSEDWTPDGIRAALAQRCPDVLVPATVHVHRSLPLTPTGKVDRAALEGRGRAVEPDGDGAGGPEPDGVEAYVAAVFGRVLGLDRVTRDDRLAGLGGDSLSAGRIASLSRRDGHRLTAAEVLADQSVVSIAARLRRRGDADTPPLRVEATR